MQTSASERVWVVSTYRHPAPPLFYLRNNQIKLSLSLRLFVCVYLCVCSSIIGCYLEIYITTYSKLTYQNVHTHIDLLTVNHQHGLTRNTCTCFIIVRAGIKVFVFSVIQQKKNKKTDILTNEGRLGRTGRASPCLAMVPAASHHSDYVMLFVVNSQQMCEMNVSEAEGSCSLSKTT